MGVPGVGLPTPPVQGARGFEGLAGVRALAFRVWGRAEGRQMLQDIWLVGSRSPDAKKGFGV